MKIKNIFKMLVMILIGMILGLTGLMLFNSRNKIITSGYKNPLTQFYVDELENNSVGGKKYTADGWGYDQTPYRLMHHYSGEVVDSGVDNYQRIEVVEYEMRDDEGGNLRAIIIGVRYYYRKNPSDTWILSEHVKYKGTGEGLICENLSDDEKKAFVGIYGCMDQKTGQSVTVSWQK